MILLLGATTCKRSPRRKMTITTTKSFFCSVTRVRYEIEISQNLFLNKKFLRASFTMRSEMWAPTQMHQHLFFWLVRDQHRETTSISFLWLSIPQNDRLTNNNAVIVLGLQVQTM